MKIELPNTLVTHHMGNIGVVPADVYPRMVYGVHKEARAVCRDWQQIVDGFAPDQYVGMKLPDLPLGLVVKVPDVGWQLRALTNLSVEALRLFAAILDWRVICRDQVLSPEIMEEFGGRLHWKFIAKRQSVTAETVSSYYSRMGLYHVARIYNLPINALKWVIANDAGRLHGHNLCKYNSMNEAFISSYSTYFRSRDVCTYQVLSEAFIREHSHWIDWVAVSGNQRLSMSFIDEFAACVRWNELYCNKWLPPIPVALLIKHEKFASENMSFMARVFTDDEVDEMINKRATGLLAQLTFRHVSGENMQKLMRHGVIVRLH